jgi:hypothetical protein
LREKGARNVIAGSVTVARAAVTQATLDTETRVVTECQAWPEPFLNGLPPLMGECAQNLHWTWETCLVERAIGTDVEAAASRLLKDITPDKQNEWTSVRQRKEVRMPEAVWSYDFVCNLSLDAIQTAFNAAGSWQWRPVDSDRHGDYLVCRPEPYGGPGKYVKFTVHEYPGNGLFKLDGLGPLGGYKAQFEIGSQSAMTRREIEVLFRHLLEAVGGRNVTEVEPFF